jgi:hypothetical protein
VAPPDASLGPGRFCCERSRPSPAATRPFAQASGYAAVLSASCAIVFIYTTNADSLSHKADPMVATARFRGLLTERDLGDFVLCIARRRQYAFLIPNSRFQILIPVLPSRLR